MACNRGRATPNAATKLKLFTDSAGFCQNPECNTPLFPDGLEGYPHLAEMAHIFAAIDGGPRTKVELFTCRVARSAARVRSLRSSRVGFGPEAAPYTHVGKQTLAAGA
jgi:hypothetical protein